MSSTVSAQPLTNYEYDAFNRRVKKTVGTMTTYYLSDGDDEVAEYDGSGNLLAEYVYGDSIDEVLTMSRGGQTYYYHHDGLGSVTDLTDAAGAVIESYNYDVYGAPSATSTIGNPFYFTGRRLDPESGLYDFRARMYSPTIGRFLQRDPIGYYDSMNLYQYTWNSPTNFIDPYGLDGTFKENFQFALRTNNQFFFGGVTQFTRTAIGSFTAGAVARETGFRTFGMAVREYFYNQRTYAPHLGMAGASTILGLGASVLANSAVNAFGIGLAVESGIVIGTLINATVQTYFIQNEEICE